MVSGVIWLPLPDAEESGSRAVGGLVCPLGCWMEHGVYGCPMFLVGKWIALDSLGADKGRNNVERQCCGRSVCSCYPAFFCLFPESSFSTVSGFRSWPCFPGSLDGKESACNAGDLGLIPGLERFPEGGNGNPLQFSPGEFHRQTMGSRSDGVTHFYFHTWTLDHKWRITHISQFWALGTCIHVLKNRIFGWIVKIKWQPFSEILCYI